MEKLFVEYEESLVLKELGFDEPCFGYWKSKNWLIQEKTRTDGYTHADQKCSAPLYQQAFRWFRSNYGLKHDIDDDNVGTKFYYKIRSYTDKFDNYDDIIKPMREEKDWAKIEFKTYEEAQLACLIKLIEICSKK